MSLRVARPLVAAALAFVLLAADDCEGLTFSNIVTGHSALIRAKNNSAERVFIALYSDDASNIGPVIPRGENTITTHIDGTYTVIVLSATDQAPSSLARSLRDLRTATEKLYRAKANNEEPDMTAATDRIQNVKEDLRLWRHPELALASCIGVIRFPKLGPSPRPIELLASITKTEKGVWAAACPANSTN